MKLESVSISNFRCFQEEVTINISDLTTIIGKNDAGKSTILEALEIFFNNDRVKIESTDANVHNVDKTVTITCEFSNLPDALNLDAGADTSLDREYLLTQDGTLKVQKVYDCGKKTPTTEVFILAYHPTAEGFSDLVELKEKELQKKVRDLGLNVPLKGNPGMRRAIWDSCDDLQFDEVAIPVTKPKEDSKRIWDQLENYLPIFALFQSDRSSRDSDSEVQDPMKAAVASAIADVQEDIERIQATVQEKVVEIAQNTHEALATIDPKLASELTPHFTPPTLAKWTNLFSINMNTEDGIPLNKRGSGVRRLILISFFMAETQKRLLGGPSRNVIYAIEEPETAQHPNNQRILIESLKLLANSDGSQVLLTTHSPGLAADLPADSIRFVQQGADGIPVIHEGADVFGTVAEALGVIPDSRVRALFCVEGPTDVAALKCLSRALHVEDSSIPDLSTDERVAFIVLGGATLKHWVNEQYLRGLRIPEVHIYDNDVPSYSKQVASVNARQDDSWAVLTSKHELECYLHSDAIKEAFDIEVEVVDQLSSDGKSVPSLFAEAYSKKVGHDGKMGDGKAKNLLAEKAFPKMTAERIRERDPDGEVEGWFRRIGELISSGYAAEVSSFTAASEENL